MIYNFLRWVLSFAKRWVDDTVAEEELHTFLHTRLRDLTALDESVDFPARDPRVVRVFQAAERLRTLGFVGLPQMKAIPALETWMNRSDISDPVLHKESIAKEVVDSFLAAFRGEGLTSTGQKTQMERLLRRIEVHRQDALQFDKVSTEDERWAAIHQVSLLCSLFARQEGDYRFLNAALKINDWSYRHHQKKRAGLPLLLYLEALLEAEIALLEMAG